MGPDFKGQDVSRRHAERDAVCGDSTAIDRLQKR